MATYQIVDETTGEIVAVHKEDPNALYTLGGSLVRVLVEPPPASPPPEPTVVVAEPEPAPTPQMDPEPVMEPAPAAPGTETVAVDTETVPAHPAISTEPDPTDALWRTDP